MTTPILSPCPLCGSPAGFYEVFTSIYVNCDSCRLGLQPEETSTWDQDSGWREVDPRPSLAAKWNRRSA